MDVAFGSALVTSEVVLSAANNQINAPLQFYPNPTSDYLTITGDAAASELTIQDMNGKVMLKSSLSGKINKIAVHQLKKGMYVATVKSDKSIRTQKLLIN